ncbi:MAG: FliM/FliN family flagellar motor switch protein [Candidatus Eremiobacteraeota bacterium]|nr:FliM/FliN family flagellar motor switch protein [Candidatus Eremiobacteraeota bacterium]
MRDKDPASFDDVMRATGGASRPGQYGKADRYDFKKGEKLTNDQERFAKQIFGTFAENMMIHLGTLLQARVQVELVSVRQRNYQSFINSLPDPTAIYVFRIDPETRGLLCLDFSLSFALLDRLMGGRGVPLEEVRSFTDLEKAVILKPISKILEGYTAAWKDVREFIPQFLEMDFNPMAVHIVTPSEMMVVISFQAYIAQARGAIDLCVPFRHLKDSIPRSSFDEFLISKPTTTTQASSPSVTPIFARGIEAAKVPVVVELGKAELMFQDLLYLEVGDCIKLDVEVTSPLKVKINEKTKFLGRPGTKDNRMSVQITKVVGEGDEEFE